jgi:hypothetical protein
MVIDMNQDEEVMKVMVAEQIEMMKRCFPAPPILDLMMRDRFMRFLLLVALPFSIALWAATIVWFHSVYGVWLI